ncbi:MAG: right-handed parallel beta-helix repeat-containing protein [Bacteroidales bacterium]|nr:right-handed parallel beta-helix repeat-containing protein [Bacteroidales bacterium]
MKWIVLIIVLSACFSGKLEAQTANYFTVGNGTTQAYNLPAHLTSYYSWSACLYKASEINYSGCIDSIYYYVGSNNSAAVQTSQKIMMAEIPDTVFTDTYKPDTSQMITVFEGSLVFSSPGWKKIPLSHRFYYSGNGTLVVYYQNKKGTSTGLFVNFRYTAAASNLAKEFSHTIYSYVFPNSNGSFSTERPNVKLAFQPVYTHDVQLIEISDPAAGSILQSDNPYDVKVKIRNYGTDTLESATIHWSVNGVPQTPVDWSGILPHDSISNEIMLGSYTFSGIGYTNLTAYTTNPDGLQDAYVYNDTLSQIWYLCESASHTQFSVDPAAPTGVSNFGSFKDALYYLKTCGVKDTTVFSIQSGIYDTLLTFDFNIPGISDSAWVVFTSASNNAQDVTLRHSCTSATNAVINFNKSHFIEVKNLTLQALHNSSEYGCCVNLQDSCTNIKIDHNILLGVDTVPIYSDRLVNIRNDVVGIASNLEITNNLLRYGAYSIRITGIGLGSQAYNNRIENNTIEDFYFGGIQLTRQNNLQVSGNKISSVNASSTSTGIYMSGVNQLIAERNNIYGPFQYGMYLDLVQAVSTNPASVENNFISTASGSGSTIHFVYGENIHFFHNSLLQLGAGKVFSNSSFTQATLRNNILANYGGGYVFNYNNISLSDYNILYTTGPTFSNYGSFSTLQTTYNTELHSFNLDPQYMSESNLHVFHESVNNIGTPIGIMVDIDGEIRDSLLPDIGADEFTPVITDAGVFIIESPIPVPHPLAGQTYPFAIKIINNGNDSLKKVMLQYEIDGVIQPSQLWTGAIAADSVSTTITLDTVLFSTAGMHSIKVWTSLPNDSVDIMPDNDTLFQQYKVCDRVLAGLYTINSTQPSSATNFRYFNEVHQQLSTCGISDSTVFYINPGIYDTILVFDYPIDGTSSDSWVIFQSATGNPSDVTFRHLCSETRNFVIGFMNTQYIEIKHLKITPISDVFGDYDCAVSLQGGAEHIAVTENIMIGDVTTNTEWGTSLIHSPNNSLANFISVTGNSIYNGGYGILFSGPSFESGNIIRDNKVYNYYRYGILCSNQNRIEVSGNEVYSATTLNNSSGMWLSNCHYGVFSTNTIYGNQDYGIYFTGCSGSATLHTLTANNCITNSRGTAFRVECSSYGDFYHNSILNTSAGKVFDMYNNPNMIVKNNIFASTGGGVALTVSVTGLVSDYNNLYTNGIGLVNNNYTVSTLSTWQNSSSQDLHSVSENPNFVSNTDLHMYDLSLNDLGTPVGIITDMDNESRDLNHPDIGADEYNPFQKDAGVEIITSPVHTPRPLTGIPIDLKIRLNNFASDTLNKVSVYYALDGTVQGVYNWTGTVLPDSVSAEVTIGQITFPMNGIHTVRVWTSMPNDSNDHIPVNDTLQTEYQVCDQHLAGTYAIDPTTATAGVNFRYFAEVLSELKTCGISDTTIFEISSGVYDTLLNIDFEIPGACDTARVIFCSFANDPDSVTISHSAAGASDNYIIRFNETAFAEFHNLTFIASGTSYGRCFDFGTNTYNIRLRGNRICGNPLAANTEQTALIYNNSCCTHIVIDENQTESGSYAILFRGNSSIAGVKNNVISKNFFHNFRQFGLFFSSEKDLLISENLFDNDSVSTSQASIYLNNNHSVIVEKNKISQSAGQGIVVKNSQCSAAKPGLIANNFVSIGGSGTAIALAMDTAGYWNVYHNTLHTYSNTTSLNVALSANELHYSNFVNNIFSSNYEYSVLLKSPFLLNTSDYNVFKNNGPTIIHYLNSNFTLLNWQANYQSELHSIQASPQFISNTDLHVTDFVVNNKGLYVGVSTDIDHEMRNLNTPDIGADEITAQIDPAIVRIAEPVSSTACNMPVFVKIVLLNAGLNTLYSIPVSYSVDGVLQASETWTGTLNSSDSIEYQFTTTFPGPLNTYDICAFITLPSDEDTSNIKICKTIVATGVGIENGNSGNTALNMAPNPADEVLICEISYSDEELCKVKILNTNGETVETYSFIVQQGLTTHQIETSSFEQGVYVLQLEIGSMIISERFAVVH